jgi:hypothetical protein
LATVPLLAANWLRAAKAKGDHKALTSLNLAIEAMAYYRCGDEAGAKFYRHRGTYLSSVP